MTSSPSGAVLWISLETVLKTQQCFGSCLHSLKAFSSSHGAPPASRLEWAEALGGVTARTAKLAKGLFHAIYCHAQEKKPGDSSLAKVAAAQNLAEYQSARGRWWGTDCLCITWCCPLPSVVKLPLSNNEVFFPIAFLVSLCRSENEQAAGMCLAAHWGQHTKCTKQQPAPHLHPIPSTQRQAGNNCGLWPCTWTKSWTNQDPRAEEVSEASL